MSELVATANLVSAISQLGQDLLVRPIVTDTRPWRDRCRGLQEQLDDRIASLAPGGPFLNNYSPLLLRAVDRALFFRSCGEGAAATEWDALVGHLVPRVRADAGAALDAMKET